MERTIVDSRQATEQPLANERIAVTGVSRYPSSHGGNVVFQRLRERGSQVFAVNPNADMVHGDSSRSRVGWRPS